MHGLQSQNRSGTLLCVGGIFQAVVFGKLSPRGRRCVKKRERPAAQSTAGPSRFSLRGIIEEGRTLYLKKRCGPFLLSTVLLYPESPGELLRRCE